MRSDVDSGGLMTTKDVAALTGFAELTVQDWRFKGRGPSWFRIGRLVRYRREDVERWLTEQQRASSEVA